MPTVRDYMRTRLVVLSPQMSVHEARKLLVEHRVSGAPVVDATGALVGILTGRDLLGAFVRASYHQDPGDLVEHCMSRDVRTLEAESDIAAVVEEFLHTPYRRFPVLEGTRVVGILSRHDVLRALEELW